MEDDVQRQVWERPEHVSVRLDLRDGQQLSLEGLPEEVRQRLHHATIEGLEGEWKRYAVRHGDHSLGKDIKDYSIR